MWWAESFGYWIIFFPRTEALAVSVIGLFSLVVALGPVRFVSLVFLTKFPPSCVFFLAFIQIVACWLSWRCKIQNFLGRSPGMIAVFFIVIVAFGELARVVATALLGAGRFLKFFWNSMWKFVGTSVIESIKFVEGSLWDFPCFRWARRFYKLFYLHVQTFGCWCYGWCFFALIFRTLTILLRCSFRTLIGFRTLPADIGTLSWACWTERRGLVSFAWCPLGQEPFLLLILQVELLMERPWVRHFGATSFTQNIPFRWYSYIIIGGVGKILYFQKLFGRFTSNSIALSTFTFSWSWGSVPISAATTRVLNLSILSFRPPTWQGTSLRAARGRYSILDNPTH